MNVVKDALKAGAGILVVGRAITGMIDVCTRSIDRAIIMMLYEGGFRIGELGVLK